MVSCGSSYTSCSGTTNEQQLKVGDRVEGMYEEITYNGIVHSILGDTATIIRDDNKTGSGEYIKTNTRGWLIRKISGIWRANEGSGTLKIINKINNKTMTSIKEKFVQSLLPQPKRRFRKVGITDGDNLLTDDGRSIFENFLFKKHEEEFDKDVVQELEKEIDKENDC